MNGDLRRLRIFEAIKNRREVSVQTLIDELGVSGMTVRRDLTLLEEQRLIRRDYGKAIWIANDYYESVSFETRCVAHQEAKKRIAALAVQCLEDVNTLFLDGSSTCREFAKSLPQNRKLTVYTNSLAAVQILRGMPNIQTFVLGGYVTEDRNSLDGDLTLNIAKSVCVDATFVSCSGFSARGLVNNGLPESRLKGVMMGNAEHTYLLADHSKWNARALFNISEWERIQTFITDQAIDASLRRILIAKHVEVLSCDGAESKGAAENGIRSIV